MALTGQRRQLWLLLACLLGLLPGVTWAQGQLINGNRTIAGALNYCGAAGGSANAVTCTLNPAITAYQNGQCVLFLSTAANTGAATLAVNALSAVAMKKGAPSTPPVALAAGDIGQGQLVSACHDGTAFQLMGTIGTTGSGTGSGTVNAGLAGATPYYPGAGTTLDDSLGLQLSASAILSEMHQVTPLAADTPLALHNIVACTAGPSNKVFTLPPAATTPTGLYRVIKADTGAGACVVQAASGDSLNATVNGSLGVSQRYDELLVTRLSTSPPVWTVTPRKLQWNLGTDVTGNLSVNNLNGGVGANSSTVWCGNGTWCTPPGGAGSGLADPGVNGYVVRSATNVTISRSIQGTAGNVSVSNPTGVGGDSVVDLVNTAVTPGSCTNCNLSVDAKGRVTAQANGTTGSGTGTVTIGTPNATARYNTADTSVGPSTGLTLSPTKILTTYNNVITITANTTLDQHNIVRCVAGGGTVTATLPLASAATAGHYTVIKDDATGICQVARSGTDTFNGVAGPLQLTKQYDAVVVEAYETGTPGVWWYTGVKAQYGYVHFSVKGADLPTANAAIIDVSEPRPKLLFDAAASWCASWTFSMNPDYGVLPQVVYKYSMTSATTGSTKLDWSVWKTSPAQAEDGQVTGYDTANTCTDAAVQGTAGRISQVTCALAFTDAMQANDQVTVKACRNLTGTAPGTLELLSAQLQYFKQ